MSGLEMKYFVLKPAGFDWHANGSRKAMLAYARAVAGEMPELAKEVREWVKAEDRIATQDHR